MALKRLIFIRAGETDWNLDGRLQGWVAIPLNAHGVRQVQRLAQFVRNMGLDAVYSSDLRRAKDTASLLAEQISAEVTFDERLRERNIGHWQGLTVPEIHGWYEDEYSKYLANTDNFRIENGESWRDVGDRVRKILKEIINKWDKAEKSVNIGIISHTTVMRVIFEELLEEGDPADDDAKFGNASVTTLLRQEDGVWRLTAVNDVTHLEGLESRYMPEVEGDQR